MILHTESREHLFFLVWQVFQVVSQCTERKHSLSVGKNKKEEEIKIGSRCLLKWAPASICWHPWVCVILEAGSELCTPHCATWVFPRLQRPEGVPLSVTHNYLSSFNYFPSQQRSIDQGLWKQFLCCYRPTQSLGLRGPAALWESAHMYTPDAFFVLWLTTIVTPLPGVLTPPSGLCGHQACA